MTARTTPNKLVLRAGLRLILPSGNQIQLLTMLRAMGAEWSCGYVHGDQLAGVGLENRFRVTLRTEWLQLYGREVL